MLPQLMDAKRKRKRNQSVVGVAERPVSNVIIQLKIPKEKEKEKRRGRGRGTPRRPQTRAIVAGPASIAFPFTITSIFWPRSACTLLASHSCQMHSITLFVASPASSSASRCLTEKYVLYLLCTYDPHVGAGCRRSG